MRHPIVSCAQILHEGQNFDISKIPKKLQSFSESLHYPVYDALLHFYEEDEYCKIYHKGLSPYINHIKKIASPQRNQTIRLHQEINDVHG